MTQFDENYHVDIEDQTVLQVDVSAVRVGISTTDHNGVRTVEYTSLEQPRNLT